MIYRREVGKINGHRAVDTTATRKHVEPCRCPSMSIRLIRPIVLISFDNFKSLGLRLSPNEHIYLMKICLRLRHINARFLRVRAAFL